MSSKIIVNSSYLFKGNKLVSFRCDIFCCIGNGWVVNTSHSCKINAKNAIIQLKSTPV